VLFNSWQFLLFFPTVTALYFALPHRFRWMLLLVASCIFYMALIPVYILILAFTILVDYAAGLLIARSEGDRRRAWLVLSIVANLSILGFFKYFNFFNDNLRGLAELLHWNYPIPWLAIALPIGLSFHIFQSLSYTIEVYRGHQAPERHLGIYALYVMFFPQLVAGPIERPQNLLHQFREVKPFDYHRVTNGLKLMLGGLFMKVVIADRLALIVNPVFDHPQTFTGITLIAAAVAFSFQIFCDFAGYSAIAIGTAEVLGFKLMTNFNRPYQSRSISEFWTRWHISLSTWFKDYLYIPLGGNRVSTLRRGVNLAIVFMVSGLWHGAAWTFVIWGALHAFYTVFGLFTRGWRTRLADATRLVAMPRVHAALQVATTFALVTFAWIFFRAVHLNDAWYITSHLASGLGDQLVSPWALLEAVRGPQTNFTNWIIAGVAIVFLEVAHLIQRRGSLRTTLANQPTWLRWSIYQAVVMIVVVLGVYDEQAFIYFQF
jgi:D-alanyl-lipoteichoic acid acyltransferase DltB (MBOAT superfamily)